jgi:hypothetical protein
MAQTPQAQANRVQLIFGQIKSELVQQENYYKAMLQRSAAKITELDKKNQILVHEKATLEQILRDREQQIYRLTHEVSLEKQKQNLN